MQWSGVCEEIRKGGKQEGRKAGGKESRQEKRGNDGKMDNQTEGRAGQGISSLAV